MSVINIQRKIITDSIERQIILQPQEEDILFEDDLVLLYRFHSDPNDGGLEIGEVFVEQLPQDTSEWAAIKEYYNSWQIPHILLFLFLFGLGVDDDAPRQVLALPNYGLPFPLPLNQPIRIAKGQGLAIELVDNGYGLPSSSRPDNFITIYGDAWLGRNEFSASTINVDATSQTTVNSSQPTQDETPVDLSQLRKVTNDDINWIKVKFRMADTSSGAVLYRPSDTMENSILFDGSEIGLWQPIANNAWGSNPDLDIHTTLRSCGHVIEVEFNQELTIHQINIVTPDFPDKAIGDILVTVNYRDWKQVYNGQLSGNITLSKPEKARKIEIVAPLEDNLADGIWKIYEINLWVAEPAQVINNDPLILQQATLRINPDEITTNTLSGYKTFDLVAGHTPPLVQAEGDRRYIEWRFNGSSEEKRLLSSNEFTIKSLLIELRSPTPTWSMNGSSIDAMGGVLAGLGNQLMAVDAGSTRILSQANYAYSKVSVNGGQALVASSGYIELGINIQEWFWLYLELPSPIIDEVVLGIGSTSSDWHKLDVDVRQILGFSENLADININEIISHFGSNTPSPSPSPSPTPAPSPAPTLPSAWTSANMKIELVEAVGDVSATSGFSLVPGGVPPEIKEEQGRKYLSWRYPNNSTDMHLLHPGVPVQCILAEIRSPTSYWGHAGQSAFSKDGFFGGTDMGIFHFDGTNLVEVAQISTIRVREADLPSPWDLSPIDEWLWIQVVLFQPLQASEWMLGRSLLEKERRVNVDLRNFLSWETAPSAEEIDEVVAFLSP